MRARTAPRFDIIRRASVIAVLLTVGLVLFGISGCASAGTDQSGIDKALGLYEAAEYSAASELLSERVASGTAVAEERRLLAQCYVAMGARADAKTQLGALVSADEADHRSLYELGLLERVDGDVRESVSNLETAYGLKPTTEYAEALASAYESAGEYEAAAALYAVILDDSSLTNSARVAGLEMQARALSSADDAESADAVLAKLALLEGSSADVLESVTPPVVDTVDPVAGDTLRGTFKRIAGTAWDSNTHDVQRVEVAIESSDGRFWDGERWRDSESWNSAEGTSTWSYGWALPEVQDGDLTYAITARAFTRSGVMGADLTPPDDVRIDAEGPALVSSKVRNAATVEIALSEPIAPDSVDATGRWFASNDLEIESATVGADDDEVLLTVSGLEEGTEYEIELARGSLTDRAGNPVAASETTFATLADTDMSPPTVPGNVASVAGTTSPVIATTTWNASTDDEGVAGYSVWRSISTTGTEVLVGRTGALILDDERGIPGETYYYSVSAYDSAGNESARSNRVGPVKSGWTQAPHETYSSLTDACRLCHELHVAATPDTLMRKTSSAPGELSVCYSCHDGQGASTNILSGPTNSFALAAGHSIEQTETGADLTNVCSSCHAPHMDYVTDSRLPASTVNSTTVNGPDNSWCLACHNDANDWYGAGYPSASTPSRDASGYPVSGTFPGRTVYEDAAKNPHASIPATGTVRQAGSCLYCHASHRGDNAYDSLTETFTPSTAATLVDDQTEGSYAASCLTCHGGELRSEFSTLPVDIKQFVTAGTDTSGHRIKTSGGTLPVEAPLPCYDCHNPHGSARGNVSLLSDELGPSLGTTSSITTRSFCMTCHSTSDGKVWNGTAYANVGTTLVEGLRRDGTILAGQTAPTGFTHNLLKLKAVSGTPDAHSSASTQDCYGCHGDSYSSSGSNVHKPTMGVSSGGQACYGCHSGYTPMDTSDASRTAYYHHVLGTATESGDLAPGASPTAYPTSASDLYCTSCHSDHNYFNSSKSSNLRSAITSAGNLTASSDYSPTAPYGICLSCHYQELPRDNTNQMAPAATTTVESPVNAEYFANSPHNYEVTSTYSDSTTFRANCLKCHNDDQAKLFQTSTNKFAPHLSSEQRILNALGGVSTPNPNEEDTCFRCHSRASDSTGGTKKPSDYVDWYGASTMDTANVEIFGLMDRLTNTFGHRVTAYEGIHLAASTDETQGYISENKHVECADCHNLHAVGDARHEWGTSNLVSEALRGVTGQSYDATALATTSWPTNAQVTANLSWVDSAEREYEICFKCHSAANTNLDEWGGKVYDNASVDNWMDVAQAFNPGNQSYHPVVRALPVTDPSTSYGSSRVAAGQVIGLWAPGDTMYCSDCHGDSSGDPTDTDIPQGPHGSTVRYTLRGPNTAWPTRHDNGQLITLADLIDNNYPVFCANCHPSVAANKAHGSNTAHKTAACVHCHILIPHGGNMSRLIGDQSTMPARLAYQGNLNNMHVESFRKSSNYRKMDCNLASNAPSACSSHSSGGNASMENW